MNTIKTLFSLSVGGIIYFVVNIIHPNYKEYRDFRINMWGVQEELNKQVIRKPDTLNITALGLAICTALILTITPPIRFSKGKMASGEKSKNFLFGLGVGGIVYFLVNIMYPNYRVFRDSRINSAYKLREELNTRAIKLPPNTLNITALGLAICTVGSIFSLKSLTLGNGQDAAISNHKEA